MFQFDVKSMTIRFILGLLTFAPMLTAATEFYSWHGYDTRLVERGRFELSLHHRLRTRHELQYLDQARFGSVARWNEKRFALLGGFYLQPQQIHEQDWTPGRRVFGGIEVPFQLGSKLVLSSRLVAERHMSTGRPNYNRFRTSERLVFGTGRVRPFLQNELLAVKQGFHSTRNSGGMSIRINGEFSVEVSYLYDTRRVAWGGDRQAVVTSMRWTPNFSWNTKKSK